jgi:hypothetical protein
VACMTAAINLRKESVHAEQLSCDMDARRLRLDRQPGPIHPPGRGGKGIVTGQQAWLQCPQCRRNWEVRIDDKVTVLPGD